MLLILAMLKKVLPDKVKKIKGSIPRELEKIVTYGMEEEDEAGVNFEYVMQEKNYYLDLFLDDTQVARMQ